MRDLPNTLKRCRNRQMIAKTVKMMSMTHDNDNLTLRYDGIKPDNEALCITTHKRRVYTAMSKLKFRL